MKKAIPFILLTSFLAVNLSGCAGTVISDEVLKDRTSEALDLNLNDFTILNRVDEGVEARYLVKTRSGKKYKCSMTGAMTLFGRSTSSALCRTANNSSKSSKKSKNKENCNDLLKEAGQCN